MILDAKTVPSNIKVWEGTYYDYSNDQLLDTIHNNYMTVGEEKPPLGSAISEIYEQYNQFIKNYN